MLFETVRREQTRFTPGSTWQRGLVALWLVCSFFLLHTCTQLSASELDEALREAVGNNDLPKVEALVTANPASLTEYDRAGLSALDYAIRRDALPIAGWLLDHGADPNRVNTRGESALWQAADQAHADGVELLLRHHADCNRADIAGQTPLHQALAAGNIPIAEQLLDHGANIDAVTRYGQTALTLAAAGGRLEQFKFLLQHKAAVNPPPGSGAQVPLMVALAFDPVPPVPSTDEIRNQMVSLLITAGADPNGGQRTQRPLELALDHASMLCIELLLAHGADPQHAGSTGNPLASLAIGHKDDPRLLRALLKYHIDPNALDARGWPILYDAIDLQNVEAVRDLLNAGADPNPPNSKALGTPLEWAVLEHNYAICELLLDHGAPADPMQSDGTTPLWNVLTNIKTAKDADLLSLLLRHGADVNRVMPGRNQTTPLELALQKYDGGLISLLKKYGANFHQRDANHLTPLEWSRNCNSLLAFEMIYEADQPVPGLVLLISWIAGLALIWYLLFQRRRPVTQTAPVGAADLFTERTVTPATGPRGSNGGLAGAPSTLSRADSARAEPPPGGWTNVSAHTTEQLQSRVQHLQARVARLARFAWLPFSGCAGLLPLFFLEPWFSAAIRPNLPVVVGLIFGHLCIVTILTAGRTRMFLLAQIIAWITTIAAAWWTWQLVRDIYSNLPDHTILSLLALHALLTASQIVLTAMAAAVGGSVRAAELKLRRHVGNSAARQTTGLDDGAAPTGWDEGSAPPPPPRA